VRRVPFSSFVRPDSFSALASASGPVLRARSHFHVLCSMTHFWRYRGRRVLFSCFAVSNSFSAVPRASGPVFKFCAFGLVFGGTEGVGSHFQVLRSRTHFRRWRVRRVLFLHFCVPGFVFGGIDGVGSRFLVLRSRTHFRRYRARPVTFSCFTLPDTFSVVPCSSGPVFKFCAPGLVFGGIECVGSRFACPFSFSCFALHDSFSAVPRALGPVVLRSRTRFRAVPRASGPVFKFCAPGLIFGGAECVGSRFHVLRARSRCRRYRWRRVPFSCFARPNSFSAVPRASGPDFMFCGPGLVFGGTEGVRSRFQVLRARSRCRRYRRRRDPFSCFARPDSF
jgi:hypothetical protein